MEARLREQAEREIERQKEIFLKQLMEQKARDSGHTDDQIKWLGRQKIARKANRAKKREGQDVKEISDSEGDQAMSAMLMDSKFIGSMTLLTHSTKSKTKSMRMSQRPGNSSSMSQAQLMAFTMKVPSKMTTSQAAVDAMLKTAVQSQLEGVRIGLGQLQAAKDDIKVISNCFDDICVQLKEFTSLNDKLKLLKEESERHSQCAAAMDNLKTIYDIQSTIVKTFDELRQGKLLDAHKHLMDLELARDDVMLEVYKMQSNSEYDLNIMKAYFTDIDKIGQEMSKQLVYVFSRTLEAIRGSDPGPQQLVSALRIVEREERIDKFCDDRFKATGFLPVGRRRSWRDLCLNALKMLTRDRIEKNLMEDRNVNKQWMARFLELCRLSIPQDLRVIKSGCESCFPPEWNIYQRMIEYYHSALVDKFRELAGETKEKNEIIQLLSWLRVYASPEMLGHPYLGIDVDKLLVDEPLLSRRTIGELVSKFVELTECDLKEWLEKALTQEKDAWYAEHLPDGDASGFYYTSLPSILFPMIEDQVQLAKEINPEIIPHIVMVNVDELVTFTGRYRDAMQAYKNKHFEDRSRFRTFTKIMISIANDCHTCFESSERVKTHIRIAVESDEVTVQSPRASISSVRQHLLNKIDVLKQRWNQNCLAAVAFLLDEIYADLSNHLEDILTRKWYMPSSTLDTICATVEDYFEDHKHLKPTLLNSLLTDLQSRIVREYVKGAESRRISFKDVDERRKCAEQLNNEADRIRIIFERLAKKAETNDQFEIITDVIPAMAEVVKLRDKSLLSLELSTFVRKFPDVTCDQLSGLLMMREDVNRLEAPRLAQEILDQNKFKPKETGPHSKLFK
uniref:Exocyst complex component Sec6 n=1 Tax=Romanomermis culicivorax TaxID=13658 RepID=A0A915LBU3_ROMCU